MAFVLTPLASNASELLSSLKFAARKRRRNASLTFAQVTVGSQCNSSTSFMFAMHCTAPSDMHVHSEVSTNTLLCPGLLFRKEANRGHDMPLKSACMLQVYGAVTMNNTLCLGLFTLVVSRQRLDWVYSSEVTAIIGGGIVSLCTQASGSGWQAVLLLGTASLAQPRVVACRNICREC